MDVNIEQYQKKIYESLKDSGWADKLKTFILSDDLAKILQVLIEEVKDGRRFVPEVSYIFKAFEKCHFNETRVVIIGQDPYPYLYVPDGLAFSCSRKSFPEASMKHLFSEISRTVYDGAEYTGSPDLTRWANQGILLLNSALTSIIARPGLHQILWRPFMAFLLDMLTCYKPGLIYVFMGRIAQDWATSIPDNNYKLMTVHPAAAAHNNDVWDCKDVFNAVNKILVKNNDGPIAW